jgi:hypothetical protein
MSHIDSFPAAVAVLETPSSELEARLNALRYLLKYVENGQEISSFTDKIKINQLMLDTVMLVLHREDLIPDLRKRQLIRAECFLMLARVLESKSLFGGTKVEQSEASERLDVTTREKQRQDKKDQYLQSTIHDPTKDLYHTIANPKDPLKVGKYDIFNVKSGTQTMQSKDDTATSEVHVLEGDDEKLVVDDSATLRSSTSAGSLVSQKHDAMFTVAVAKSPNKYNTQKGIRRSNVPRQTVIAGAKLEPESVRFQGVNPYDVVTTDKRIGYQKSRMWVPHAGSGIKCSVLLLDMFT